MQLEARAGANPLGASRSTLVELRQTRVFTRPEVSMPDLTQALGEVGAKLWKDFPTILKPIEDGAHVALNQANEDDNPHRATGHLVEHHLAKAQASIEKCQALKRLAHEIEAEAVKAVWNKILVEERSRHETAFDEDLYTHRAYAASEQYGPTEAAAASPRTPSSTFAGVRKALAESRSLGVDFESALDDRRRSKGSAFHYVERHETVRMTFTELLVDAYLRCRACIDPLSRLFEVSAQMPTIKTMVEARGILDGLSKWVRDVWLMLEQILAFDSEVELNCWVKAHGLGMKWTNSLAEPSGALLINKARLPARAVRLRGLGIGLLSTTPVTRSTHHLIRLTTPTGLELVTNAAVLNDQYGSRPTDIKCSCMYNQSPFGSWTLEVLDPNAGTDATAQELAKVADILLCFKVATLNGRATQPAFWMGNSIGERT